MIAALLALLAIDPAVTRGQAVRACLARALDVDPAIYVSVYELARARYRGTPGPEGVAERYRVVEQAIDACVAGLTIAQLRPIGDFVAVDISRRSIEQFLRARLGPGIIDSIERLELPDRLAGDMESYGQSLLARLRAANIPDDYARDVGTYVEFSRGVRDREQRLLRSEDPLVRAAARPASR